MRVDTAVVTILGVRIVLVFPHPSYVYPGVGDLLIKRLEPHFPTTPIMLVHLEYGEERAYATFQTAPFLTALDIDQIFLREVDLDVLPVEEIELPF
ncbi:hypothetical protein [Massilia sp. DD77]|uniref:hypothetical protein n=1 Tax=Massilia sp. DD77 TaxID=3109349 RepID=UPI002FFDF9B8